MFAFFWVRGVVNGGRFAPYPQKNLREGTKRGRRESESVRLTGQKKRQKIRSKAKDLHPLPKEKKWFPICKVQGEMYILSKHSKCLIKFITFVYGLGTRDSQ
jgi:hypothetical protein